MLLNLTSIGFTNLFRCLIIDLFFFTNADSKMRYLKKICETNAGSIDFHWFHEFSLDVSSLIVTTSAFVKKERSKMRHLKIFVKPMEVKLRSKMSH